MDYKSKIRAAARRLFQEIYCNSVIVIGEAGESYTAISRSEYGVVTLHPHKERLLSLALRVLHENEIGLNSSEVSDSIRRLGYNEPKLSTIIALTLIKWKKSGIVISEDKWHYLLNRKRLIDMRGPPYPTLKNCIQEDNK